jgi:hypothetical protein
VEDIENSVFMFDDGPVRVGDMDRDQLLEVVRCLTESLQSSHDSFTKLARVASSRKS